MKLKKIISRNKLSDKFIKNVYVLDSINELKKYYKFTNEYSIIENDLDTYQYIEDINSRKRLDASVLSLISANADKGSKFLDIGTYTGRSAARMAVNSPDSTIYTVNIAPNDASSGGKLVTEILSKDEIGSFYRKHNLKNIKQVYANTRTWNIPEEISDLSLVYVDGCHDRKFVYSDTKKILDRVKIGGYILWHDFSSIYRKNHHWIHQSMLGVNDLYNESAIYGNILNVRNSWIGIWQKTK